MPSPSEESERAALLTSDTLYRQTDSFTQWQELLAGDIAALFAGDWTSDAVRDARASALEVLQSAFGPDGWQAAFPLAMDLDRSDLEMLFAILDQMVHASAGMVTGPLVVDICKGPLNGIRSWAVGGQIEQLEAGMGRQPLLHLSGVVNLGIVGHTREVGESRRRVGPVERLEQVPEEARAFALPHAVLDGPGADIQRPSQVALLVGAWGHDLHLRPLGHPLITDLRQQTNIQLIGKEQGHADPHLLKG